MEVFWKENISKSNFPKTKRWCPDNCPGGKLPPVRGLGFELGLELGLGLGCNFLWG